MPCRVWLGQPCVSNETFSPPNKQWSHLHLQYSGQAMRMGWGVRLAFELSFQMFLSRLQRGRDLAGVQVLKSALLLKVCRFTLRLHILYLLVLQVYKSIFTSSSSAKDIQLQKERHDENTPPEKLQRVLSSSKPVCHSMATKLHLNGKVTPRSIAYSAVHVCLFLLYDILCSSVTSSSIFTCKLRVHGPRFMVDSTTKVCTIILLMFSRILLGVLQRSMPKNYSGGGLCKLFSLHNLKEHLIHSDHEGKSSQLLPSIVGQTPQHLERHSNNSMQPSKRRKMPELCLLIILHMCLYPLLSIISSH